MPKTWLGPEIQKDKRLCDKVAVKTKTFFSSSLNRMMERLIVRHDNKIPGLLPYDVQKISWKIEFIFENLG